MDTSWHFTDWSWKSNLILGWSEYFLWVTNISFALKIKMLSLRICPTKLSLSRFSFLMFIISVLIAEWVVLFCSIPVQDCSLPIVSDCWKERIMFMLKRLLRKYREGCSAYSSTCKFVETLLMMEQWDSFTF